MKFLFDLFPILMFFGVFRIAEMNESGSFRLASAIIGRFVTDGGIKADQGPIMLATIATILGAMCQIGYLKLRRRKVDLMLWLAVGVITIFGGLTIYFHNETFIKWKPTIIYWLQAVAFMFAQVFFQKNLIREVMETQVKLPGPVWQRMYVAWVIFFFVLGLLNLLAAFVIFKGNTSAWVSFKLFGINGLLLAFIVAQTLILSKYMDDDQEEKQA